MASVETRSILKFQQSPESEAAEDNLDVGGQCKVRAGRQYVQGG